MSDDDTGKQSPGNKGDGASKGRAQRIRSKISASQARSRGDAPARKAKPAARKRSASGQASFVDKAMADHPLALLAGSVVLGAIAASLFPASWGRKLGSRMLGIAAVAGELGATYGNKAWGAAAEGARAGQDKLEDVGETLADQGSDARRRAIELGTLAGKRIIELAGSATKNAREASGGALKALGDLSDRARS